MKDICTREVLQLNSKKSTGTDIWLERYRYYPVRPTCAKKQGFGAGAVTLARLWLHLTVFTLNICLLIHANYMELGLI